MTDNLNENVDDGLLLDGSLEGNLQSKPRDLSQFFKKIPVTLTLEVGRATISLAELLQVEAGTVIELDKVAGSPLDIKVNGTLIGHAEVVVAGENYGLRIVELMQLDFDQLSQ